MRRALGLACVLALASPGAVARAQMTPAVEDGLRPAPDEGEESPELRALRLIESEVFGGTQSLVELSPQVPRALRLSFPEAMTSEAPLVQPSTGAADTVRDLSWLEGLTLPDIPVRWDARVIRYLEFFRDDPRGRQLIRSWMRRVERFGPSLRATLRAEGLPEDLLYVAMIESGFDPRARSDAGAVGLWQFVSGTGEEYGLTQDHWVDLRMDPEASTTAAARYLGALQARFGTWELAFAAYNMGYGALLRAIRKYDTNDFWELSHLEAALPFETDLYVAKVTACAIVGRNPERFGLAGLEREAPIAFETVEVPGGAPLASLARAAGVDAAELRRLNPALLRDRLPPGRERWSLRLPEGRREAFEQAWARQQPRTPLHRPHMVRFGEDLAGIARRYRTTEAELRRLNEMDEDAGVGPGWALMVPAVAPRVEERPAEPITVAVPPGRFEYTDRRQVFYRVHRTDRIAEVARFFGVTPDEIRRWNAVEPRASLQDGMFLQLFVPTALDLSRALVFSPDEVRTLVIGSEEFFDWHVRQEGRVRVRYRAQPGDTLSGIAARFGLSVGSLVRINLIPRDSVLRAGQELVVYTDPSRVPGGAPTDPAETIASAAPARAASGAPSPGRGVEASQAPSEAGVSGTVAEAPVAAAQPTSELEAPEDATDSDLPDEEELPDAAHHVAPDEGRDEAPDDRAPVGFAPASG